MPKTLRLILGDQLNSNHSWFNRIDDDVIYLMMELRSESEYVKHHIQKILGFFASMRDFSTKMKAKGHRFIYIKISDSENLHGFESNIQKIVEAYEIEQFEYLEPDEYRLDLLLKNLGERLRIQTAMHSTEHFISERNDVKKFFGKKRFLLENFYRHMRKKHNILMDQSEPLGGQWNYDQDNRKKFPNDLDIPEPYLFDHDLSDLLNEIKKAKLPYFGNVNANHFMWPINREEGLEILEHFIQNLLHNFGPYQDAMSEKSWSNFHSRLSFALNLKMISPLEVIQKVEKAIDHSNLGSIEGFIRQILGWREYMRGVYWAKMPEYAQENYFEFKNDLPEFFWTGNTKMKCLSHAIGQSLDFAYAHHIQRLMISGNFALLMQCDPDAVDAWYLGVYIDAIEWVEITNTRGMSQYADGGLLSSKPYISSANYIHKMSSYCKGCHYDHLKKTGENACPFNSLYWHFLDSQKHKLQSNPRMGMMYNLLGKMDEVELKDINVQALYYLENRNSL